MRAWQTHCSIDLRARKNLSLSELAIGARFRRDSRSSRFLPGSKRGIRDSNRSRLEYARRRYGICTALSRSKRVPRTPSCADCRIADSSGILDSSRRIRGIQSAHCWAYRNHQPIPRERRIGHHSLNPNPCFFASSSPPNALFSKDCVP